MVPWVTAQPAMVPTLLIGDLILVKSVGM